MPKRKCPLNIQRTGDAEKEPIVFLHGFMGTGSDWEAVTALLAADYCCATLNLPGHGGSPALETTDYEQVVAAVDACVTGAGLQQFHLAGYSMGGRIAIAYAKAHPEKVKSLILIASSPGLQDPHERALRREIDERWAAVMEETGMDAFLQRWYDQPIFSTLRKNKDLHASLISRKCGQNPRDMAKTLRGLSPGVVEDLWVALPALACHVLWVAGREDIKYVELADRAASLCQHGRAVVVPDAGHVIHEEQPKVLANVIRDFIRGGV